MELSAGILVSFVVILYVGTTTSITPLGPADILIERIDTCEEPEKYAIANNIVMNRLNRTHAGFTGCFHLLEDFDSSSLFELTAAKWGDGGWKPNAFNHAQNGVCETLNMHVKEPWTEVLLATGRENKGCPMTKGDYCAEDFAVSLEGLFPNMLYGKFRVTVNFSIEKRPMFCIVLYILSSPSKSG